MPELWELPAEEIAKGVAAREWSASEVVDAALARTAQVEPLLGAYLAIYADDARERAREIDRRLAAGTAGEAVGPLAGVPIALKDNLSLAGKPLTCG